MLDWAGLRGEPPQTFHQAGRTYFVTGRTVAHRFQRVAAEGARLPLTQELIAELSRPAAPGEDPVMQRRCAHLLGINPPRTAPPVTADAHVADPPAARIDSSPGAPPDPPTPPE